MTDSPLLSPMAERYWNDSRQPLMSLVFIMPMMLIYEIGVWKWGVQNGADVWMGKILAAMDFRLHLFLPLLTVAILLGWHYLTHHPWRFSLGALSTMAVESLMLAVCLRILLIMQGKLIQQIATGGASGQDFVEKLKEAIGYLGAGIYEELLFRLFLVSAMAWIIRLWMPNKRWSMVLAVLASSILFSAAHYVGTAGYRFDWFSFSFRVLAGCFFAILFIYRGFGITAGTHALYDITAAFF